MRAIIFFILIPVVYAQTFAVSPPEITFNNEGIAQFTIISNEKSNYRINYESDLMSLSKTRGTITRTETIIIKKKKDSFDSVIYVEFYKENPTAISILPTLAIKINATSNYLQNKGILNKAAQTNIDLGGIGVTLTITTLILFVFYNNQL